MSQVEPTAAEIRAGQETAAQLAELQIAPDTRTRAVIFDIDGVLCDNGSIVRDIHNEQLNEGKPGFVVWDPKLRQLCMEAPPRPEWVALNQCIDPFTLVFLVTNRHVDDEAVTVRWLDEYKVRYNGIFMWDPETHEYFEHKREAVTACMQQFNVALVFEDNRKHCAMYEQFGLQVIYVPGGFDE